MTVSTTEHKMLELAGYFYHSTNTWTAPMCVLQACAEYKLSLAPHMLRLFTLHLTRGIDIATAEGVVSFHEMHTM